MGRGRARAQLGLGEGRLADQEPARRPIPRFADLLESEEDAAAAARLRRGESVGRPLRSYASKPKLTAAFVRVRGTKTPGEGNVAGHGNEMRCHRNPRNPGMLDA
jgi:hypothetical protein